VLILLEKYVYLCKKNVTIVLNGQRSKIAAPIWDRWSLKCYCVCYYPVNELKLLLWLLLLFVNVNWCQCCCYILC